MLTTVNYLSFKYRVDYGVAGRVQDHYDEPADKPTLVIYSITPLFDVHKAVRESEGEFEYPDFMSSEAFWNIEDILADRLEAEGEL